jgi:DNA segregation ATPase FtsK/SpoIIIE, S-DNA-T family
MARKKQKAPHGYFDDLSPQTKQAIGAVFFLVLGTFFILSSLNYAGPAGEYTHKSLTYLFGYGFVLAPIVCLLYVYVLMRPREDERISISKAVGVALLFLSVLGLLNLPSNPLGGMAGGALAYPLILLFGKVIAGIVLGAIALVGIFLTFDTSLLITGFLGGKKRDTASDSTIDDVMLTPESQKAMAAPDETDEMEEEKPIKQQRFTDHVAGESQGFAVSSFKGTYEPPSLALLRKDRGKPQVGDIKSNANIIKRTLKNFNIDVEMDEVSIGPTVTRYALKPAEGVRISKIVGLQNNLELALAASPIRIEAPIPGKSLVGIEVPNLAKTTIGLASLLASPEYTDSPKPLLVALGRDIMGRPHFANIAKMPHGLIAGTTGSGKSVTIHAFVVSLLFRNSPDQLRFIMIDPKRVELTLYNDIPHLLTPVITDAKKAILSLKWAIKEMERRYEILQEKRVRDISSYHENVYQPARKKWEKEGSKDSEREGLPEPLPYIVIIIDELADLMATYPRELEASIVRLAQMSRAVGIHLILSTQRPSVNVITGLIKANVPSRLALKVASQVDSRTILDQVGAEKLLGAGDMLFLSGELAKPQRLQSAFISEEELKKVVDYLKSQHDAQELSSIDLTGDGKSNPDAFFESGNMDDDDDLYEDAKQAVIEAGKASTSYIQRKLRVGYSRAARLIDILEERGVIGPADGAKPREILIGRDENPE